MDCRTNRTPGASDQVRGAGDDVATASAARTHRRAITAPGIAHRGPHTAAYLPAANEGQRQTGCYYLSIPSGSCCCRPMICALAPLYGRPSKGSVGSDAPWNAVSAFANCGPAVAHVRGSYVPEGGSAPPQMTIKEATNGGPLAQPAAFRVVTSARRHRSRSRESWRICCQRLNQSASV